MENGEEFTKKELLPIIGCEFNVCKNLEDKTVKDNGYQVVLLAKIKTVIKILSSWLQWLTRKECIMFLVSIKW